MYVFPTLFVILLGILSSSAIRQARYFNEPYTSTLIKEEVHTRLVPSSCVLVEPTLPPCRMIRFLRLPNAWGTSDNVTENVKPDNRSRTEPEQNLEGTQLSWGEYLGIYRPTVTTTDVLITTTTIQDPNVIVTYSVMGCVPLSLPDDMDRCSVQQQGPVATEVIPNNQPILATVVQPIYATAMPINTIEGQLSSKTFDNNPIIQPPSNDILPSIDDQNEEPSTSLTDALP